MRHQRLDGEIRLNVYVASVRVILQLRNTLLDNHQACGVAAIQELLRITSSIFGRHGDHVTNKRVDVILVGVYDQHHGGGDGS